MIPALDAPKPRVPAAQLAPPAQKPTEESPVAKSEPKVRKLWADITSDDEDDDFFETLATTAPRVAPVPPVPPASSPAPAVTRCLDSQPSEESSTVAPKKKT